MGADVWGIKAGGRGKGEVVEASVKRYLDKRGLRRV